MKTIKYKNINYVHIDNCKQINTIILPGFLQTYASYENLFQTLSLYSNIYVLELPGFGISENLPYVVNLDYYVILLKEFINDLNLNNVVLFGHSFGGRVICKYESLYNNSLAIILMDSAGIRRNSIRNIIKITKYKIRKKVYKIFRMETRYKMLIQHSGSKDYQSLDSISKQTFNNIIKENTKKYLSKIKTLTLLIWGELDKETPYKFGEITNKKIKNSTLIKIKDAGHFPHIEKSILVNNIISSFYKGVILLI